jgi:hypothetical protein
VQLRRMRGYATLMLLAVTAAAVPSYAQYPEDFHPYTFDASIGWPGVDGADRQNFGSFRVHQAGAGFAVIGKNKRDSQDSQFRHWNLFMTGDFPYGSSKFTRSLQEIVDSNPQMPSLLSANAGTGKFFSVTLGPRSQYSWRRWGVWGGRSSLNERTG